MCVIVGVNCVIRFRSICTLYNLPPGEKNDIPNIFSKLFLQNLTERKNIIVNKAKGKGNHNCNTLKRQS